MSFMLCRTLPFLGGLATLITGDENNTLTMSSGETLNLPKNWGHKALAQSLFSDVVAEAPFNDIWR